jgi:hypothetical protein
MARQAIAVAVLFFEDSRSAWKSSKNDLGDGGCEPLWTLPS